ncbi:putative inner membrane protein [Serratia symbiotica str. Tucson]|nr:putative inner membrane protein [Serratia symbiotica str. Tucson]BBI91411.1 inner membrane protein [Serratia symbiotica]
MSIFIGALIWLVGARIGGREQVAERYWWIKHVDKHCRDDPRRKSH